MLTNSAPFFLIFFFSFPFEFSTALKIPKIFTYQQLWYFTRNFEKSLGGGSFGGVYQGWVTSPRTQQSGVVAVKVSTNIGGGVSKSREEQWRVSVSFL